LLRILSGADVPDTGTVSRTPPGATVGYLPQEADRRAGETLRAFLARRTGVAAANDALETAAGALASGGRGAEDEYAAALDAYMTLGAADFDARLGDVCADVGLPVRLLDVATVVLSGGEAARASLAAILLARFDVFLLDEPTNDLDFGGLARLERFLMELSAGAVIVSHDRAFLDRTITRVLEIDEHSHHASEFAGGWSAYLDERAIARRNAEEAYADYRAKRGELADRAQRQRQWSQVGVKKVKRSGEPDKNIRHFRTQSSEHVAAKAKITDRALERLEADAVEKPWEGWQLRMEIASAPRSGSVVARLEHAVVERGSFVLGPIDLEIGWQERVAIVGANGSGKSTLLSALLGRSPLAAGARHMGPGVVVGELAQGRDRFGDKPLLDAFEAETGMLAREARSLLAKFGLGGDHVARIATTLSPGERTRAELALFMAVGVNCLVLDEPTNHLDLPAIEQLEQALESYDGTLLLVTHDRALLDAVRTTRTIEIVGGNIAADRVVA
jgi:ATPase subunit of ABC transporter with duplicated ATPase domains